MGATHHLPTSRRDRWLLLSAVFALLAVPRSSPGQEDASRLASDGRTGDPLRALARQIANPIGPLWQLTFDHAITGLGGGGLEGVEPGYTGSFEPRIPIGLSQLGLGRYAWAERYNVLTRLTLPFVETVPLPAGPDGTRGSGFGDIQLASVLAPDRLDGWAWAVGPTFILPSASSDALGQGKWQAGPAVVAGYNGRRWTAYAVAQQWWSFAGDGDRPDTSQLCLNYVLLRNLPHGWQVGMQPSMSIDWKASRGDGVSFPVGMGVGKTLRLGNLPVQLWVEADYYAVRADDVSSPRWGIDIQIIPVIE